MPSFIDLTGEKFGRLLVLRKIGVKKNQIQWECRCDCGNISIVSGGNLRNGHSKSCGCLRRDFAKTHGMCDTRFYSIWKSMKQRCFRKSHPNYIDYGGRGITVCDKWENFEGFKEDMYDSYLKHVDEFSEKQTTLDRIDNNGNYQKGNCRWATYYEQVRNRSIQSNNTSGITGVYWDKELSKWNAKIKVDGKNYHLGYFDEKEDAASTRLEAEEKFSWPSTTSEHRKRVEMEDGE